MKLEDFADKLTLMCMRHDANCPFKSHCPCPHDKTCKDVTRQDWVRLIIGLEKPAITHIRATCKDCTYMARSMVGASLCIIADKHVEPESDYCDMYEKAAQPRAANS